MTILGVTVVAVIGGLATSIMVSGQQRDRVAARAEVRTFGEKIQTFVLTGSGYQDCAPVTRYEIYAPAGYTADVTTIAYWIPTLPFTPTPLPTSGPSPTPVAAGAFGNVTDCQNYRNAATPPRQDGGIQRLTLRMQKNGTTIHEDLVIHIRRPCRAGETCD